MWVREGRWLHGRTKFRARRHGLLRRRHYGGTRTPPAGPVATVGEKSEMGYVSARSTGPPKADNKVRVQVYECEGSPPMPEMV